MNDIKIIICTTFRDFNGSENDEIQKAFLKSIENQTYQNFELVVTLFGEKNVQKEVEKFNFKSSFFNSSIEGHRYSLTKVILNAIDQAEKENGLYLIFWTTCDIIYDDNFFEIVIKNYTNNIIGTSHPHITFSSLAKYNEKINNKEKLFSGFDLIYFDKFFLNHKIKDAIKNYTFNDWGVFEHFLISLNELNKESNMINIYEESKVYKIENDRELTNELDQFLMNSHKLNSVVFNKFLDENNITSEYFDLAFCHFRFKITKNAIKHYWSFRIDVIEYIKRKFRRNIAKLIPDEIKKIIKGKKI